ncbi:MAG: hypothetical protein K2X91_16570 [Thermoleophilia bacterium]|nr:hypothetical protein [Thermoleophilia bacterium]
MTATSPTVAAFLAVAALGGLYALHRLALRLEEQGHLYYLKRKPGGGASRVLAPLQEAIDPASRHVFNVQDERRTVTREDVPDPDDPPGPRARPGRE